MFNKQIDPDDIDEFLFLIEKSFGISFSSEDFFDTMTFGDLCSMVKSKINLDHSEDCTNHQAFNKLRKALTGIVQVKRAVIVPETSLEVLLLFLCFPLRVYFFIGNWD